MPFDAGSIKGSIDLDASQFDAKLASTVGSAGAASGQIKASFSGVEAVLTEEVVPSLGQVAAAATAAAEKVAPAVQQATSAASASVAAMAPSVEKVAAAATAAIAAMAPAAQQVAAGSTAAAASMAQLAEMGQRSGRVWAQIAAECSAAEGAAAAAAESAAGSLSAALTAVGTTARSALAPISPAAAQAASAIGQAAATASAGADRAASSVARVAEAFPRVDAAADRAGRAIESAIGPAVQRAAANATARLDAAAIGVERVVSGTLSPAMDRVAARAGTALASLAPAVAGVGTAAGNASASMAKVGDLAAQVSAHVSTLFGQARAAAEPLAGAIGSVGQSLAGLRISAIGAADSAAAAFRSAAEPLTASLTPALERVAQVAGVAFDRMQAGAAAAGSAAQRAGGQVGQMAQAAAEAGAQGAGVVSGVAGVVVELAEGPIALLGSALAKVGSAALSAAEKLAKLSVVGTLGAATAAAAGFYEAIERAGDRFHEMGLAAERAGVNVEWLSRLSAVAGTANVDLQALSTGFRVLEDRAAQAAQGDKAGIDAFKALGISAQEAASMMNDPQAMFERVRRSLAALQNQSERAAAAQALLGRGGNQLIPLMTMDPAEFDKVADRMKGLGGTVSAADAEMGRSLGELHGYFDAAMLGIERAAAKPVLAYLKQHMDAIVPQIQAGATAMVNGLGQAWAWLSAKADELLPHMDGVSGVAGRVGVVFDRVRAVVTPFASAVASLGSAFGRLGLTLAKDVVDTLTVLDPKLKSVDGTVAKIGTAVADAVGKIGHGVEWVAALIDKTTALLDKLPNRLTTFMAGGTQAQRYAQEGGTVVTRGAYVQPEGPAPTAPDRPLKAMQDDVAAAEARLKAANERFRAAKKVADDPEQWATAAGLRRERADADAAAVAVQHAQSDVNAAQRVADSAFQLQVARGTRGIDPAAIERLQLAYNEAVRRQQTPWGGFATTPLVAPPAAAASPAAPIVPPAAQVVSPAPVVTPAVPSRAKAARAPKGKRDRRIVYVPASSPPQAIVQPAAPVVEATSAVPPAARVVPPTPVALPTAAVVPPPAVVPPAQIDVNGFNVPELIEHDDELLALEMTIVRRPFVVDFASVVLDLDPELIEDEGPNDRGQGRRAVRRRPGRRRARHP